MAAVSCRVVRECRFSMPDAAAAITTSSLVLESGSHAVQSASPVGDAGHPPRLLVIRPSASTPRWRSSVHPCPAWLLGWNSWLSRASPRSKKSASTSRRCPLPPGAHERSFPLNPRSFRVVDISRNDLRVIFEVARKSPLAVQLGDAERPLTSSAWAVGKPFLSPVEDAHLIPVQAHSQ